MQKKNKKNVIAEDDIETDFTKKNFNYNVEDYLNIYNNTQTNLFSKSKTLLLTIY